MKTAEENTAEKKGKAGNKFGVFAELILTAAEALICGFEET